MKMRTITVIRKRMASIIMSAVIAVAGVGILPQYALPVQAADVITSYNIGTASVIKTFNDNCTIEITGSTTSNAVRIEVASGKTVTVNLNNVTIDLNSSVGCAFKITGSGNVIINLTGTNTFISGYSYAGLQKESSGKLTISGNGSLTANGGESGAGIGGGSRANGSDIEISGGTITANGGEWGAGIGGGSDGDGTHIEITGGTVTATGGRTGAGIGGGCDGDGTHIEISGGTVTATGGEGGAGIGGGYTGNGTHIEISGGTVTATGGSEGAGIGSGSSANGSDIEISGGTVTATGGRSGAGIGGGIGANGSDIEISGGTVTATGGIWGAGIGGGASCAGSNGNGVDISISGGTVYAIGGDAGAGIGGGMANRSGGTCSRITINGSSIVSVSGGADYDGTNILGSGSAIGTGGHNNDVSGDETTPDTSGLYTTGCIKYYPAGTRIAAITAGTVQPSNTITGSVPDPQNTTNPTVVNASEPETPVNYMQEVEDKITVAIALGGSQTVLIEGYPTLSYHVMEMLKDNPEITLVSEFSYDGLDYKITIPGSAVALDSDVKWYGPKYLFSMYYLYGADTMPSLQAYLNKYK